MKLPAIHGPGTLAAVAAASLALVSCGTSSFPLMDASTNVPTTSGIAKVQILPDTVYVGQVGQTTQMQATVIDSQDSTVANASVVWDTGDPSVATVTSDGLLTGVGEGQTTVTATAGGAEGSAVVIVSTVQPLGGTP